MRKTRKSVFYELFNAFIDPIDFDKAEFVIDGGFLLHRVVWEEKITFFKHNYKLREIYQAMV